MLNTIVAEELAEFSDELEKAEDFDSAVKALIKKTFTEHERIIFNGDGYDEQWVVEAERRGLSNLRSTPEALKKYLTEKNVALFVKHKVYSEVELQSRYEIQLENYSKVINIEAETMLDMSKKDILPAVSSYVRELADTALSKKALSDSIPCDVEIELAEKLSKLLSCFATVSYTHLTLPTKA